MTTPESIGTSLDWSKKLKEAGFPQGTSVHTWFDSHGKQYVNSGGRLVWEEIIADAPTAEEILRRLPDELEKNGEELGLVCQKHSDGSFDVCYQYWPPSHMQFSVAFGEHHDTLANAAAAMYCYLAEQKLLPTP